jgi:hypothetical protein
MFYFANPRGFAFAVLSQDLPLLVCGSAVKT